MAARSLVASATSKGWSTGRTRAGSTRTGIGRVASDRRCSERIGDLGALAAAEVVDLAGLAVLRQEPVGADHVADVGEVADDVEVADLHALAPARFHLGHLKRQRGQHVAGRLPRPGVVERPDHHHVRAVRQVVLDPQQVDRRLARRIRDCWDATDNLP